MESEIWFFGVGLLGGLVRAVYGVFKTVSKGSAINIPYFVVTLIISTLIGGLLGIVFDVDYKVAALSGYVGTDILENVFKGTIGKEIKLKKN